MSRDSRLVRASEALGAEVADQYVVLSEDLRYLGLNGVARRVWELLAEPRSAAELADVLIAEYDVDRDRCETELATLLDSLARHRLVIPA